MAMILEKENAILDWREKLGPTSPYKFAHLNGLFLLCWK